MAKHTGRKIVCDIPQEIIDGINEYRVGHTEFANNSQFFNSYFLLYLSIMHKIPSSIILLYSQFPNASRNNFSFYLDEETYLKFELLADSNLRPVKNQATHMVYSIFYYISSQHF